MTFLVFGFFAVLFFITTENRKIDKKLYFSILFISLLLIVCFRPFDWGADADTYIEMYNMVNAGQKVGTEITFSVISRVVFTLGNCVKLLFVFYAFISLYLKISAIKKISYLPALSFLIYFSCWFILHDVYQIRVGAAIAVSYFSLPYLCEKKYGKFLLLALIATLFHTQAALLFLLIFMSKRRISLYSVLILVSVLIFSYAVYFLHIDLLKSFINLLAKTKLPRVEQIKYYYEISQSGIVNLGKVNAFSPIVLVRLFLTLVLLFQYRKLNDFLYYPVLIRILILSFAIRMFAYPVPVIGMRVYEFFTCFDVFVFPLFFKVVKEKKAVFTLLFLYCFFMLFIILRSEI